MCKPETAQNCAFPCTKSAGGAEGGRLHDILCHDSETRGTPRDVSHHGSLSRRMHEMEEYGPGACMVHHAAHVWMFRSARHQRPQGFRGSLGFRVSGAVLLNTLPEAGGSFLGLLGLGG